MERHAPLARPSVRRITPTRIFLVKTSDQPWTTYRELNVVSGLSRGQIQAASFSHPYIRHAFLILKRSSVMDIPLRNRTRLEVA